MNIASDILKNNHFKHNLLISLFMNAIAWAHLTQYSGHLVTLSIILLPSSGLPPEKWSSLKYGY